MHELKRLSTSDNYTLLSLGSGGSAAGDLERFSPDFLN
jgi:hypothetical protein